MRTRAREAKPSQDAAVGPAGRTSSGPEPIASPIDLTESALTAAALVQYMDGDGVDEELVVRRLDGLTQAVAQVQHDLDVLGVAFGGYTWRGFLSAQAPTPEGQQRATSTYWDFLRQAYEQISQRGQVPATNSPGGLQASRLGPVPPRMGTVGKGEVANERPRSFRRRGFAATAIRSLGKRAADIQLRRFGHSSPALSGSTDPATSVDTNRGRLDPGAWPSGNRTRAAGAA